MGESTNTTTAGAEETGPMLMVITLKSGVQIRTDVEQCTIGEYRAGGLANLKWTATEAATQIPKYVDMAEVAAVHTEWPKAG